MKFHITLSYKNSYCNCYFYIKDMKNYYSSLRSSKKAKNERRTTIFMVFHSGTVFEIDLYLFWTFPIAILPPNCPNTRFKWKSLLRVYTSRWQEISSVSAKEPPFICLTALNLCLFLAPLIFRKGEATNAKQYPEKIHRFSGFYSKTIFVVADAWMDVCTRVTWFTLKKYKSKPNL